MPVDTWFTTAERWFETNVVDATELATFGFVMLCVLLVALVVLMFSLLGSLLKTLRNASGARAARNDKSPGYRVLVARPAGKGSGRAWKWLLSALNSHLSEFNFGAPLKVFRTGTISRRHRNARGPACPSATGSGRCGHAGLGRQDGSARRWLCHSRPKPRWWPDSHGSEAVHAANARKDDRP